VLQCFTAGKQSRVFNPPWYDVFATTTQNLPNYSLHIKVAPAVNVQPLFLYLYLGTERMHWQK